jgi:hypothetical protein
VAVDKIVFAEAAVDPGLHLEEAAFVQELADADPRLCGIVAHAPMERAQPWKPISSRSQRCATSEASDA